MSENRLPDYLDHIQQAATDARSFVEGMAKDDFLADKRTQQAVIMSLIVIGEAATKVMDGYVMARPVNLEVRSRLLSIGRQVVHNRGFNGCGVQDITAAAEIPKGSFYNYFASKEDFAAEILEEYWTSIETRHGPIFYDARVKPLERIGQFFQALVLEHGEHEYSLGCLIGNLSLEMSNGSEQTRKRLADVLARWEGLLASCLREAQQRRELSETHDAEALASVIVEGWEGAVMRGKVLRDGAPLQRFVSMVLPRLLE
jgi:TetR/AcrR family transcriptional repressor of nem operon